jgi:hypothetical protein
VKIKDKSVSDESKIHWIKTFFLSLIFLFTIPAIAQDVVDLEAPISKSDTICGAGFLTLNASSSINDPNLLFEWFAYIGGRLQFLGSLDGSTGKSQFITSFLIADKNFAVRVRLGNSISPYVNVRAEILNEATILQQPEIQLCGEVYLEVVTNMDSIESYQWQVLVGDDLDQSFFKDLTSESSDSTILIAKKTGFYRVIVTDSLGCQAISGEVEVNNDPIVIAMSSVIQCYDPAIPKSDSTVLVSNYGRALTKYFWEVSIDSINFSLVDTTKMIGVSKPTTQEFDTAYYRLTITEQNCSNDTTIAVYWRPVPEGTIRHINPLIGSDDFFFCGSDDEADRTLQFTPISPDLEVKWYNVNFSQLQSLDFFKSYSGENGPQDYLDFKSMSLINISENVLGSEYEMILDQMAGGPLDTDGGLIFAIMTDTISNCSTVTNGIFADTSFPFPMNGVRLAYNYSPGASYVPICVGGELEFTSYDQTADAYAWLKYDEGTDSYTELDSDETFNLIADEDFEEGTYYLEVTKNGCTSLSEGFNVAFADPPTVEITNIEEDEVIACNEMGSILLYGRASDDAIDYQWYYSVDDVDFFLAPGDSANHFYQAEINGYYKLSASNAFCSGETNSVYVEIPDGVDPDFIEVKVEGDMSYCEGDEIRMRVNYQGPKVAYFWFYATVELGSGDVGIGLVELGGTTDPELVLDSRA